MLSANAKAGNSRKTNNMNNVLRVNMYKILVNSVFNELLLILGRSIPYHKLLGDNLLIDFAVAIDITQQQLADFNAHLIGLVLNDRHPRCDISSMHIICESYQCHIFWYTQSAFLDSCESCKRNNIIK